MAPRPPSYPDVALNLALAVIASSAAPLLLLSGDLTLIAASKSFCRAFQIDPDTIKNRLFGKLGAGEWEAHRDCRGWQNPGVVQDPGHAELGRFE